MDRLASIRLYEQEATSCSGCGMDFHESNDCCRNEVKVVKLVQDQNNSSFPHPGIAKFTPPAMEIPAHFISPVFDERTSPYFYNHSPPLLAARDTYLVNCVFRI